MRYAAALLGRTTVYCPNTGVPGRLSRFIGHTQARTVVLLPQTAEAAEDGMLAALVGLRRDHGELQGELPQLRHLGARGRHRTCAAQARSGRARPDPRDYAGAASELNAKSPDSTSGSIVRGTNRPAVRDPTKRSSSTSSAPRRIVVRTLPVTSQPSQQL